MRILTGAKGFIGRNFVVRLIELTEFEEVVTLCDDIDSLSMAEIGRLKF
jgi:nucleoside-diphosphate-sugar epimerase